MNIGMWKKAIILYEKPILAYFDDVFHVEHFKYFAKKDSRNVVCSPTA